MAYGGTSGPSGSGRARRFQPNQRTIVIVAVVAVLGAILVGTHRITRFEIIYFCVLVPSIILHELSHGVVALVFGDDTAKRAGRLTLNPIAHVDPVGTLLVPAILSLGGLPAYGWAKPVPVSTNRLRSPRNHTVIVSLAGPLTNFALAALMGLGYVLTTAPDVRQLVNQLGAYPPGLASQIFFIAGLANLILGIFNLIPCPPLDGAAVLERLLPARVLPEYYRLQPALMFLPFLLILLFRNQWAQLLGHVISWWSGILA